ncbi:alkaline phosphatase [Zoogloea sp. LCSB751]|uniref:alkaline phosphatase n=1 Tax=Zoogloea sp. LCSB751 TaxID=1965277 RepID=UPI0009A53F88|nr:alkaline phosphatase [Zoogloea sp. LCSB751]
MLKPVFLAVAAATALLAGCGGNSSNHDAPKNVIFFLGDGMGINTLTAARIYKVGEDGDLTIDTLPETAFVKTYSNNAQVTDSAPSMAAYMTGVKMNNEVISMSAETAAFDATGKDYLSGTDSTCPATGNGKAVTTLLELAKSAGWGTGAVTTTRITHATPAVTYSHVCHRDAENTIAAQAVPGGAGYNTALGDGVDVLLGGGRQFFLPTAAGGKRTDGRDLTAEFVTKGYTYVKNKTEFDAAAASSTKKLVGLFTSSHMSYDLDRDPAVEPSLAEMTTKAIDILSKNDKGFFLMVEGGRIDHALHETTAKKALQDTVAFDEAIKTAIAKMKTVDADLKNTLIVVTADHDHTIVLNGYAARTGATTASNPGVLGLLKNFVTGALNLDSSGNPFTIIGFGNGENRPATRTALTDAQVADKSYHQEAAIPMAAGSETHGGTDVFLGAIGRGADKFTGVITNTEVFNLIRQSVGL